MNESMTSVHGLEKRFKVSDIGKKFTHDGPYGRDTMTIISKEEGFGIIFHSDITGNDHHLDNHTILKLKT